MTKSPNPMLADVEIKLARAIKHLAYSEKKVKTLSTDTENLGDADLESWEGFVSRFARVSDLFISKYIRLRILEEDPAFQGTVRDYLNLAEKLGIISDANLWMTIRKLRNVVVHDYNNQNLKQDLSDMRTQAPTLLDLGKKFHAT